MGDAKIWEMQDLSLTEKCMLSLIYSFNINGKEFNATNRWLANFFGLKQKYVSEILNNLSRKNRIGIQIFRDTPSRNIGKRVSSFIGIPIQKKPEVYNKVYNNKYITESDIIKKEKFEPPAHVEILNFFRNYLLKEGYNTDMIYSQTTKFLAHYTANGWKTGQNNIVNWQAVAIKWILGDIDKGIFYKQRPVLK